MNDWCIVLSHNRQDLLNGCIDRISPQVDSVIVVDNASDPPAEAQWIYPNVTIHYEPLQPPNLAYFWNRYLDLISGIEMLTGDGRWNVALLCDDSYVEPGWYDTVRDGMRAHGASAASTHSYTPISESYVLRALTNGPDRMCPWAFMIPGEEQLRADETMHWWFCDTDLDWQARQIHGTVVLPGPIVPNLLIGEFTNTKPELAVQAGLDGERFREKWGA